MGWILVGLSGLKGNDEQFSIQLATTKWSTIGSDSGTILFHIFITGLNDQTECSCSKFAGEDAVCGNMSNGSKTSSYKELDKLEPGNNRNLTMFRNETTQNSVQGTFKLHNWLLQQ